MESNLFFSMMLFAQDYNFIKSQCSASKTSKICISCRSLCNPHLILSSVSSPAYAGSVHVLIV